MKTEVDAIMLFIAELMGSFKAGSGTKEDKIVCGQNDYVHNVLHTLDLSTEADRKELNENMWLERLYGELDEYFSIPEGNALARRLSIDTEAYRASTYKWSVPIEIDATASLLQIVGVLLNDKRLMNMTNVIGDTLEDAWKVKGISRSHIKTAMTAKLYGSSKTPESLWKKNKIAYTAKEAMTVTNEIRSGAFGLANAFKDFIISNCHLKPAMEIKIGTEEFGISCNKFRNVGEKTKAYKIWSSEEKQYNTILHTDTKKVPDLEQFRLYTVTLLIHHLDSHIMDSVVSKVMDKYQWAIPVHDAIIVSPAAAEDVRKWYGEELKLIHTNRDPILSGFFKSIGITAVAKERWDKLKSMIVPLEDDLQISMPLK